MKKYFLLLLIFFPYLAFAQTQVELSGPNQVALGQDFDVQATLKSNENLDISDISIKGQENFELRGTSSQSGIQIINGKSQTEQKYTLSFHATNEGTFTLGPVIVSIGTGKVESSPIQIVVGPASKGINTNSESLPYDEYGVQNSSFPYFWLILFVLGFLFFVAFYFILSKYYFGEKTVVEKEQEILLDRDIDAEYADTFHSFLTKIDTLDKNQFYGLFNETMRKYFEEKGLEDSLTLTYDEIKRNHFFKKNLSSFGTIFSRSYREEFTDTPDSEEERKKLLLDTIDILNSK